MSASETTALRLQLRHAGYFPIPIEGKAPAMKGWQNKHDTTEEEIVLWEKSWHFATNTGILTKFVPTLDVDITDEEAACAVEDLVRRLYEKKGYLLVRTGRAPKRAIPFRTDQPFNKLAVNVTKNGSGEKIELLCDGQQLVVAGIHPDTKDPYRWHGGELQKTQRKDLPSLTEAEARKLVEDAVDLLVREHGYTRGAERPRAKKNGKANNHTDPSTSGADDWQWLYDNIHEGRELHDSLRDLAAKMIKSGTNPGAAVNQLRALMNSSNSPRDLRWTERYNEIPGLVGSAEALPEHVDAPPLVPDDDIKLEDFVAHMPTGNFIFKPTREMWPATSVNGRLPRVFVVGQDKPIAAATWIKKHAPVEQMTWSPGEPMLIKDRLISEGGWFERQGCTVFNLYRPPTIVRGNANEAGPWLDHIRKIYPNDADHLVKWLAHRVQRPQEKINHAIVLGGAQGIGKDTLLEPAKHAIGPWNFSEVSPQHMLGRFNGFVKSVILRVSEARDLGDVDRYAFYDHLKSYTAAPPDVLRCDEKNLREHSVLNCCGVIITTNHKTDGIYLPADDRRHYVAWSDLSKSDFGDGYWVKLWQWYGAGGGDRHVADYLFSLNISAFDAKAPPPKTEAFWAIVDANRAPEDGELADVLDMLGWPDIVTISQIAGYGESVFAEWLRDRKNARRIPHRFEACNYVAVRNDSAKDGQWKIEGKRQVVYGKAELPLQKRIAAARMRSGGW
jgi:hypothetical protein